MEQTSSFVKGGGEGAVADSFGGSSPSGFCKNELNMFFLTANYKMKQGWTILHVLLKVE